MNLDYEDRLRIVKAFHLMHQALSELALEEEDLTEWAQVEWSEYVELSHRLGFGYIRDMEVPQMLDP